MFRVKGFGICRKHVRICKDLLHGEDPYLHIYI